MTYFKIFINLVLILLILNRYSSSEPDIEFSNKDLKFSKLATRWDEAIPLGNGMLGALVWKKADKLRFSLDRADLWDLRPMPNLDTEEWKYEWVYE